jgi:hypothetical protein
VQANNIQWAEGVVAGLAGVPNSANTATGGGTSIVPGVINWNQDYETAPVGNFQPDDPIPGIPGTGTVNIDNISAEMVTYVRIPEPGVYSMGVNSDDGFRLAVNDVVGRQYVEVLAPSAIAGFIPSVPTAVGVQGNVGGPITKTPVVADVVMTDPADACADLVNAAELAGKIALIDRGTCGFIDKLRRAQAAGAVAGIMINERPDYPIIMGGDAPDVTIPVLMITQADGAILKDNLDGLRISIQDDTNFILSEFNNGRGSTDTMVTFFVSEAGIYPFRCLWFEGGGGANCEWFTRLADGTSILLNDTSNPDALLGFRSRDFTPPTDPNLAVGVADGVISITWDVGTLVGSSTVDGTYSPVPAATSPYVPDTSAGGEMYYQVQLP